MLKYIYTFKLRRHFAPKNIRTTGTLHPRPGHKGFNHLDPQNLVFRSRLPVKNFVPENKVFLCQLLGHHKFFAKEIKEAE